MSIFTLFANYTDFDELRLSEDLKIIGNSSVGDGNT